MLTRILSRNQAASCKHAHAEASNMHACMQRIEQWLVGSPGPGCRIAVPHLHVSVQPIADNQIMGNADPVWLHRVAVPIVEIAYLWVIIVGHLADKKARCMGFSEHCGDTTWSDAQKQKSWRRVYEHVLALAHLLLARHFAQYRWPLATCRQRLPAPLTLFSCSQVANLSSINA